MLVGSVTGSIASLVGNHGVYAVFVLMAIDAVFPAASEVVLLYAGALAAGAFPAQHLSLFGAHIGPGPGSLVVIGSAATIGYLVGALIGWAVGRFGGRPFLEKHGRWLHLGPTRVARAERWFDRWGLATVLVGRIAPVIRSFVSIPAGVFGYPFTPYAVLTLIGSGVWSFALAGAGYAIGTKWETAHSHFRSIDYVVLALIVGTALWIALRRRSART